MIGAKDEAIEVDHDFSILEEESQSANGNGMLRNQKGQPPHHQGTNDSNPEQQEHITWPFS